MIPLQNVQDLALDDSEHSFYTPRGGDWALLALVIVTLLGTGLFAWHQLAGQGAGGWHAGRAIFFAFVLISIYWSAILYALKLSVSIRVGPSGLSIVRGPWRTELPWREVVRLVERNQVVEGQRLRWILALARDERRLQIREDMVDDYVRFRMELYDRYRLWRDHGGTWGAAGGGPFEARETVSTQMTWWSIACGLLLLPGLYFLILIPESGWIGPVLLVTGLLCALLSLRALARRQTYYVDAKAIDSSRFGRTIRLPWREVTRVDRSRHAFNFAIKGGIVLGRFALNLAMRNDKRIRTFEWYPRVPEYLIIRGAGHQIRVNLHRVARPDELIAWVEFYERVGRRASADESRRKKTGPLPPRPVREPVRSPYTSGPLDPWADDTRQAPDEDELPTEEAPVAASSYSRQSAGNWLRGDGDAAADPIFENTPTEEVPSSSAVNSSTEGRADDMEDLPTAEMQATLAQQSSQVTPPFGNNMQRLDSPGNMSSTPAITSLDQLWAPRPPEARKRPPTQSQPDPNQIRAVFAETDLDMDDQEVQQEIQHEVQEDQQDGETHGEAPDGLAESFAPWRTDANWQPPALPRYGPPLPRESDPSPEQRPDSREFSQDEFLR
jgi:hypothetical protein